MTEQIKPRFTGIFIPVEILEMEELSPREIILLSWIDALYDKAKGGCFASNEYLADRLQIKPNTVAKTLVKLRNLNFIESVSFDGRQRVMRAMITKRTFESQEGLEKNPQGLEKRPTQGLRNVHPPTKNIHIDESKDERKEIKAPSLYRL